MRVIGLTGGIGSGKSTVAQFLAELGAVIVDADRVGHELLKYDNEIQHQVMRAFGRQIAGADGEIDRQKLGEIVFGDPEARTNLNRIIHPRMYDIVKAQLEEYRRQAAELVVLDAPVLIEAGWSSLVDKVWVTTAPEATVLKRLSERAEMSEQESRARIRSQLSSEERTKHADAVIDTDCRLDVLQTRVTELWQGIQK